MRKEESEREKERELEKQKDQEWTRVLLGPRCPQGWAHINPRMTIHSSVGEETGWLSQAVTCAYWRHVRGKPGSKRQASKCLKLECFSHMVIFRNPSGSERDSILGLAGVVFSSKGCSVITGWHAETSPAASQNAFLLSSQQPLKYILFKFLFSFTIWPASTMKGKKYTSTYRLCSLGSFITVKKQTFVSVLSLQLHNSVTLGEAS